MRKESQNNKLLIISRGVPPKIAGSSVVIENLLKGFTCQEIMVVGEKQIGLKNNNPPETRKKIVYNTISIKMNWFGTSFLRKAQIPSGFFLLLLYTYRFKPNKIIIIYPGSEYLLMGYLLSKFYTCDYFSYFHNTYSENRKTYKKAIANWLQKKIFNLSKIVFLISDGMVKYYENTYPHTINFKSLVHSFTEDLPLEIDVAIAGKARLAFIGNINESCKEAASRLFYALSKIDNVVFYMFTSMPEEYFLSLGINRNSLVCVPQLGRNLFINKLRECDIMLLPHGFSGTLPKIEYETMFPTKTIEYLISGKPILYHGPGNVYLTNFLKENNCALVIDEMNEKAIQNGLKILIEDKFYRALLVQNALKAAIFFQINQVVNRLKEQIN